MSSFPQSLSGIPICLRDTKPYTLRRKQRAGLPLIYIKKKILHYLTTILERHGWEFDIDLKFDSGKLRWAVMRKGRMAFTGRLSMMSFVDFITRFSIYILWNWRHWRLEVRLKLRMRNVIVTLWNTGSILGAENISAAARHTGSLPQ